MLRESLSNVVRHAEADAAIVEVEVAASGGWRCGSPTTGRGCPPSAHESGLRNVRRRAADLGGQVRLLDEEPHGTRVEWWVPLDL